jgi:hypothetical protein
VVCKEGRKISKKKIDKVKSWPEPENPTHVRGFLGVFVYVKIFIPGLSELALPLRKLTYKDADLE